MAGFDPLSIGASAGIGALSGWAGSKKDAGTDAGNWLDFTDDAQKKQAQGQLSNLLNFQSNPAATDPIQSSRTATSEVQNNPMLSGLLGPGGTMQRTGQEEQNLSQRGFSLKPEDYEAYGQGSDQIAREFGAGSNSLAQALSDRGLSNSGSAGASFTGLQGNKMEQLGQLQRQIANDRMNMNLQRLGQTRQFLGTLGGQAQNAIQDQFGRQQSAEGMGFNEAMGKNSAAQSRLQAGQDQANEQLMQRQQTQRQPGWAAAISGAANSGQQAAIAGMGPKKSAV